ncbi:unnamed protein product, partial [Symbiodinium sp. CCMP2456]
MSDRGSELRTLRQEITAVRVWLERLEARVSALEEVELISPGVPQILHRILGPVSHLLPLRLVQEVAESVGRFLRRALDGAYRGSSGRDQLSAKALCIRVPDKGQSIFVGLPSQTEGAAIPVSTPAFQRLRDYILEGREAQIGELRISSSEGPEVSCQIVVVGEFEGQFLVLASSEEDPSEPHRTWRMKDSVDFALEGELPFLTAVEDLAEEGGSETQDGAGDQGLEQRLRDNFRRVVDAARAAGIPESQLAKMSQMASAGRGRLGGRAKAAPQRVADPLDESDEEEEFYGPPGLSPSDQEAGPSLVFKGGELEDMRASVGLTRRALEAAKACAAQWVTFVLVRSKLSLVCSRAPRVFPSDLWSSHRMGLGEPLTKVQFKALSSLRRGVEDWNRSGPFGPEELGRGAPKFESLYDMLHACQEEYSKLPAGAALEEAAFSFSAPCHALPVEPDRLNFVGRPSFDPRPYLDTANRRTYEDPIRFAEPLTEEVQLPHVAVRASKDQVRRLLELLDSSGRLALFTKGDVRPGVRSGLFSVPKDGKRDRFVLDARPPNALECSESRWIRSLGTLEQIQFMHLPEDCNREIHAEDLKEFYHSFIVSSIRSARNSLALELSSEDVAHLSVCSKAMRNQIIIPALGTMAMGDTNAVAYGQTSHLSVLYFPASLRLPVFARIMREVVDGYRASGLPRHEGKSVSRASVGDFWGGQLDGKTGLLRPSPKRVSGLAAFLLEVVRGGVTSVGMLEVITGSLVSSLQLRRRLLSLLDEVYAAQQHRPRNAFLRVRGDLCNELLAATVLLCQVDVDIRAPGAALVLTTDASSTAEAGAVAEIPAELSVELSRHSLQRGLWSRLLSPAQAFLQERGDLEEGQALPGDSYTSHPLWEEVCCSLQFRQFGKIVKVAKRRHINVGEVRAAIRGEEGIGRRYPGSRYVHLQDSQVSLATFVKGRSSSRAINFELRTEKLSASQRAEALSLGFVLPPAGGSEELTKVCDCPAPIPRAVRPPGGKVSTTGKRHAKQTHCPLRIDPFHFSVGSPGVEPAFTSSRSQPCASDRASPLPSTVFQSLRAMPPGRFVYSSAFPDLDSALSSGSGWLDLFSGVRGFAKALAAAAPCWILCLDVSHGEDEDLLDPDLQGSIFELLRDGAFAGVSAAPVCASFSSAIVPTWRSRDYPQGKPGLRLDQAEKVIKGNLFLEFLLEVIVVCEEVGAIYWIENPSSSWFWRQPAWSSVLARLMGSCAANDFFVLALMFIASFEVATPTVVSPGQNLLSRIPRVFATCSQLHVHLMSAGSANTVISILADVLNVLALGSAKLRIQDHGGLGIIAPLSAWRSPELLVELLKGYGQFLYDHGASSQEFRQLLAHAQHVFPRVRCCRIGEVLSAFRGDLLTPSDLLRDDRRFYIVFR